jgi:hypothetical protein
MPLFSLAHAIPEVAISTPSAEKARWRSFVVRLVIWCFHHGGSILSAKENNRPPDIHEVQQSG